MDEKLDIKVLTSDTVSEERTLFMSFGLLNELCSLIGSPERISFIDSDADMASQVVMTVLIPRHPSGKPTISLSDYSPPGVSMATAETILDWVKEHVLNFFCRRIEANLKLLGANKDRLKEIGLSVTGLQLEASKS